MWTPVSLLHLLNLLVGEAPGRSSNSGPTNLSLVTNFRSMSRKLNAELAIRLEQQSSVDNGIHIDQWALSKSQVAQPFNDM